MTTETAKAEDISDTMTETTTNETETVVVKEPTKYKGGILDLDALENEIKELEAERSGIEEEATENTDEEEEETKDEDLTAEELTFKKRYGDLRSYSQKRYNQYEKNIEELKERLEKLEFEKASPVLPTTKEELEQFITDYPDVYAALQTIVSERLGQTTEQIDKKLEKLSKEQEKIRRDRLRFKLQQRHPDLEEINHSQEFKDWVAIQPDAIKQVLFGEDDPDETARLLDIFKYETKWKTKTVEKENEKLAATEVKSKKASEPKPKGKKTFKESDVAKMNIQEFEKLQPEITAAIQSGRFIYDLSQPQG